MASANRFGHHVQSAGTIQEAHRPNLQNNNPRKQSRHSPVILLHYVRPGRKWTMEFVKVFVKMERVKAEAANAGIHEPQLTSRRYGYCCCGACGLQGIFAG
jgi:hypothetical protein